MRNLVLFLAIVAIASASAFPQGLTKRKIIIDQDCAGPGSTNTNSIIPLLFAEDVEILGITVSSGDSWLGESVEHCLRLLELVEQTNIPVYSGAVMPLINTRQQAEKMAELYGGISWMGAFAREFGPYDILPENFPEGRPERTSAAKALAAEFIVEQLNMYPGEVSIIAMGPATNLATALSMEPRLPGLAKELYMMAGSINCGTDCDGSNNPRFEFNFWFDPEGMRKILREVPGATPKWSKITMFPLDVAAFAKWTPEMVEAVRAKQSTSLAADYLTKYTIDATGHSGIHIPMFDELPAIAFLYPDLIMKPEAVVPMFIDADVSEGAYYGSTLSWGLDNTRARAPGVGEQVVNVVMDVNFDAFYSLFVEASTRK